MNKIFKFISIVSVITFLNVMTLSAKDNEPDPYKGFDETLYMDMDLEENLTLPKVGDAARKSVVRYMDNLGKTLAKRGYIVDMTRDDEVLLVTIPTDNLFFPNDTLLMPTATALLRPLVEQLKDPMMFKLVYSVHTDDTGSHKYNMDLSHLRNNSLYDWLLDNIDQDLIVIPYEMGDTDPIATNDTRTGRKENRRVEFFFIPGPKMIEMARKERL